MTEVLVRPAVPGDLDAMRDIFRRACLWNEADLPLYEAHPELLDYGSPPAGALVLMAVDGDRLVGFASGQIGDDAMELVDLFVEPDAMGRGVGRALVGALVDAAESHGVRRIEVDANRHALAFYERVGFVPGAEVPVEFGTAVRMHLVVQPGA